MPRGGGGPWGRGPWGGPWGRRRRPRTAWRLGCALVVFIGFGAVLMAAVAWVVCGTQRRGVGRRGRRSGSGILLLVVVLVALGVRWLRGLAEPVDDLVAAAGRVEAGDYGVQVRERGPREARTLARAFNQMSARLAATERERRGFLADVTHELRTPLAVVRGNTEAIADGVYPADDAHLAPILDAATTPRAAGRRPAHGRPGGGWRRWSFAARCSTSARCWSMPVVGFASEAAEREVRTLRPTSRTTCRRSTPIPCASPRSSATWSPTPCGTRRRAAP